MHAQFLSVLCGVILFVIDNFNFILLELVLFLLVFAQSNFANAIAVQPPQGFIYTISSWEMPVENFNVIRIIQAVLALVRIVFVLPRQVVQVLHHWHNFLIVDLTIFPFSLMILAFLFFSNLWEPYHCVPILYLNYGEVIPSLLVFSATLQQLFFAHYMFFPIFTLKRCFYGVSSSLTLQIQSGIINPALNFKQEVLNRSVHLALQIRFFWLHFL